VETTLLGVGEGFENLRPLEEGGVRGCSARLAALSISGPNISSLTLTSRRAAERARAGVERRRDVGRGTTRRRSGGRGRQ